MSLSIEFNRTRGRTPHQGDASMPKQGAMAVWIVLGLMSGLGLSWAILILLAPDIGPPPLFPYQDKVFHVIAFGCLTGPAAMVLPKRYLGFWTAHMLALGAGIEIVQMKMNVGRTADVTDFLADAVGVVLAVIIARLIRRRFEG